MQNKTLHILRTSPFSVNLEDIKQNIKNDDALIMIDDGCYLLNHPSFQQYLNSCEALYAIKPHILARGLNLNEAVNNIDMKGFTGLIFEYSNSVTW